MTRLKLTQGCELQVDAWRHHALQLVFGLIPYTISLRDFTAQLQQQ